MWNSVFVFICLFLLLGSCRNASYRAVDVQSENSREFPENLDVRPGSSRSQSSIQTTSIAPGELDNCPAGGIRIETGRDLDQDGRLLSNEVTGTTFVCNGAQGQPGKDGLDGKDGVNGRDGTPAAPVPEPKKKPKLIKQEFVARDPYGFVEIILAIDTSKSMRQEMDQLAANMALFLNSLEQTDIPFRVTAIGSDYFDFPESHPKNLFRVINQEIGSFDSIGKLTAFLNSDHDLRPDAGLEIFIFSDDNGRGQGNLATDFRPPIEMNYVKVSGIIGLKPGPDPINARCFISNVGTEYQRLANRTNGIIVDICLEDWSALLNQLSTSIRKDAFQFKLLELPESNLPIIVTRNGEAVPPLSMSPDGYFIDESKKSLILSTNFPLNFGDIIAISYQAKLLDP